ncbi:BolA family protein [Neisseria weaveri]|uniref:BolA/YrbA family protein n=1 Tax=Neisseria weaveri TaxID=28091 RepID=A0A448VNK9_9NEIS|nr:BolA family protein [Neisseria weaveri]EGV36186.1 BolA family protein [Neisseria weaveri ATCC 51223]SAY51915.1 BolA/YrbA family protein [Neisseria weaveri]VEJ51331.1 BolA/YrbA family protein [Neisseria weaveri]
MLSPEQVKAMIEAVLPCQYLEVEGDGHHFFAVIVSEAFEGKARLARHRLVKDGLAEKLASNELHALSISTAATPAEWAAKQQG